MPRTADTCIDDAKRNLRSAQQNITDAIAIAPLESVRRIVLGQASEEISNAEQSLQTAKKLN